MINNDNKTHNIAARWVQRMETEVLQQEGLEELEAWLAISPRNSEAFRAAQEAWSNTAIAESELEAVLALAPNHDHSKPKSWHTWMARWQALLATAQGGARWMYASAVFTIALCISFVFLMPRGSDHLSVVATQTGQSLSHVLPDRSVVELNTKTRLGYGYSPKRRTIELYEGEAFFDVEPDYQRPFEIAVGPGSVRVLGTSFNLKYVNDRFELAVQEGQVSVELPGDKKSYQVSAGGYFTYGPAGMIRNEMRDPGLELAWREGALAFENETLRDVLSELDRYFDESLSVPEQYGGERLTGVIFIDDLNQALEQLSAISSREITLDAASTSTKIE